VVRGCEPSVCGGQVVEIGDLVNSGVRRLKTQVLGTPSREMRGREAARDL
jgi:hypothetical protein